MNLAERIEAAGVDEQRAMLEEAFAYIHKMDDGLATADWSALNWPFADRFTAMLDAEAYESAAMLLVDNLEDVAVTVTRYDTGSGFAQIDFPGSRQVFGIAKTPALALAAAAIRAGAK